MSEKYELPSIRGTPIVMNDEASLTILRGIDKDFSGVIKTDEDYHRAVFYFRAAGLKEDIQKHPEYKKYDGLFEKKENIDFLFDCIHADGKRIDEMLALDDKYIALSTAFMITQNDALYEKYEDEGSSNNKAVQTISKMSVWKPYLDSKVFADRLRNLAEMTKARDMLKNKACKKEPSHMPLKYFLSLTAIQSKDWDY